jgi:hypothetical protein
MGTMEPVLPRFRLAQMDCGPSVEMIAEAGFSRNLDDRAALALLPSPISRTQWSEICKLLDLCAGSNLPGLGERMSSEVATNGLCVEVGRGDGGPIARSPSLSAAPEPVVLEPSLGTQAW